MNDDEFINLNQFYNDEDDDWEDSSKAVLENAGSKFCRYKDPVLLASGGMKDVYKVYDSQNRRFIAMAKLRDDVPDEQCEDFFREAYLTASLEHPNIISLYDIGVDDTGVPFFTMELKVGDSLGEIIKQRSEKSEKYMREYPLHKLLEIFIKVCDAVSYAHSVDILHLDIKPDNIQVGKFGEVQVCDWGLGSNIEDANIVNDDKMIKGTPGYMPPEQIQSDLGKDFTTDIYALGALLYTLLTDNGPAAGGIKTVIQKTLNGEFKFPLERYPDNNIPESLDAVVRKAMSLKKEDRYSSVEQLKNEVEKYLAGHSTSAENAGFLKELSLFYKRNRQTCIVALCFITILVVGSSMFILKLQKSHNDLQTANSQVIEALDESEENYELYKEKVAAEQKLTKELLDDAFKDALLKLKAPLFYAKPVKYLNEALETIQKHHEVTGKGTIVRHIVSGLIIAQRFDEVEKYRDRGEPQLIKMANRFIGVARAKHGRLQDDDFIKLLKDINELPESLKQSLMERVIAYHLDLSKRVFSHPDVVRELIKCWNPKWSGKGFRYNVKDLILKVHGPELNILSDASATSSGLSFLRFLKANYLDVKGTALDSLKQLNGFSVRVLDLRETKVDSLRQVRGMKNLNKLIIAKDQFNKTELDRLPPSVRIEYK